MKNENFLLIAAVILSISVLVVTKIKYEKVSNRDLFFAKCERYAETELDHLHCALRYNPDLIESSFTNN